MSACVLVYGLIHFRIADRHGLKPSGELIWLAMVCAFGFALCPYLDLTFHEAKQATDEVEGKRAFGIGFGLIFCSMIILTMSL